MAKKKKSNALVVDDSPTMRRIVVETLHELGWATDEADNGSRALQMLEQGSYDLVCTDWNMPVMNGLELSKAIRARPAIVDLPILMSTTRNTRLDVVSAIAAGADDFVAKPFAPAALQAKLHRVVGKMHLGSAMRELAASAKGLSPGEAKQRLPELAANDPLSQDDIDALLYGDGLESMADQMQKAMEEKDKMIEELGEDAVRAKQAADKAAKRPIITSYDFKHPARVNKDQLRTMENLHDNFARLLSSTFSGAMRAIVDVDTAFVDQTTYREFIMSLSNPSCSYQFTLGPTNGQVIIDVPLPLVSAFVDRTFGGKGSSQGASGQQLTPIEIGVINNVVKRVIEDLEATWEPILPVEIYDIELETNPEFMQITAAQEIVILMAFEVNSTNASGLVSVCYPFFTLEPILPKLGQNTRIVHGRPSREEMQLQNRLRLAEMDVPLVAELGRTKVKLAEAEALQEGDIIRLPTRVQDPLAVHLGGRPKLLARPFGKKKSGELKLKVVGEVPVDYQDRHGGVEVYPETVRPPAKVHEPER